MFGFRRGSKHSKDAPHGSHLCACVHTTRAKSHQSIRYLEWKIMHEMLCFAAIYFKILQCTFLGLALVRTVLYFYFWPKLFCSVGE